MAKANYEKPTVLVDLEERQKSDYQPRGVLQPGVDPEPSENGYIGVDPNYQNYANETDRPLQAEKGAEFKVEQSYVSEDVDTSKGATPEGEREAEEEEEEEEENPLTPDGGTTGPSSPKPPSGS